MDVLKDQPRTRQFHEWPDGEPQVEPMPTNAELLAMSDDTILRTIECLTSLQTKHWAAMDTESRKMIIGALNDCVAIYSEYTEALEYESKT